MAAEIILDDSNFQNEVIESDVPVVVDFWAPWCGPCRLMIPIMEALAEEYDGRVKIGKLNTDEAPEITGEYGVISIPTTIIFKDGKAVDQIIGAVPKDVVVKKLEAAL
ncbi:thioredoxin [bacterium]|nr:thioredoxin [bacterium]